MESEIIGHEKVLDFFAKVVSNDSLSHAYCFVGLEQLGKQSVARKLSAKLLEVEAEKLNMNPDFSFVEQQIDEKTGKTKRDISVDQVRDLREYLARKSFTGGYRVALVDRAEKMSIAGANALLKTLEEPGEKTVLFLITKDESRLPSTIRSRCQTIYFHPVAREKITSWLEKRGLGKSEAEEAARLSQGLPGRAYNWLEDEEEYERYKKEADRFLSLINKPFFEKIKIVDDLFGDKTDHIAARENLHQVLGIWQVLSRDLLYNSIGLKESTIHHVKEDWNKETLMKVENGINKAREMLGKNIHPKLLIENILLNIP